MPRDQVLLDENSSSSRWDFLAPWTAQLMGHELHVKTKRISDDTSRFQFDAIYMNMQRNVMLDHASHQALQTTAEAVHLVSAALALFPEAWSALLIDQCECSSHFDPSIHEPIKLTPRFEFDCGHFPGEILMTKTGLRFFQVLLDSTARTAQFHTAMQQLLELSEDSLSHVRNLPLMPFKIDLSLWNEDRDILLGFTDFVSALKPFKDPSPQVSGTRRWCFVEAIEIDFTGPGICSNLVQRTFMLAANAPFVQISNITIDPQTVSCSREELGQFLAMLTSTYPNLSLRLGDVVSNASGQYGLGESETNSASNISMVLDAICSTPAVFKYVNVGHLMTSDNRAAMWNHLFGTLLSPQSICGIQMLALNSTSVLNVTGDTRAIELATRSFPNYRLPTRLTLGLTDANHASLRAIVSALGANLQHLCMYDRHCVIPSEIIALILEMCPKLESLDLDNVAVDSMAMFFDSRAHCRLSRLVLHNVMLRDSSSLSTFLTQLADPQSPVGSSLSEFVLARYGYAASLTDPLVIAQPHIRLIHNALRVNGRIHTLQLDADATVPPASIDACLTQHRSPAAVRLAPFALTRKLAFLSALDAKEKSPFNDLSEDVLRNVFAFAAECKPRWVHIKHVW